MYKQRLRAASLAIGLGMFCGGNALAEGFYFGVSGGVTSADISKSDFDDMFIAAFDAELDAEPVTSGHSFADLNSRLDDSDKGWGVQVGYRWGPYFAAEVGYVDLGKALYESRMLFTNPAAEFPVPENILFDAEARFESQGPTASVLGMFPITERFDVYARAGLYFADTRVRLRSVLTDVEDSLLSGEVKGSSSDLLFGIGATWNINDNYSVRLEFQRFADVGDSDKTGEADVDLISLGFLFR